MPEMTYAWAPITKTSRDDDGTLLVYGPAASSDLDRDQQRLSADWLDAAMPRWLADGGNVREQHDAKRAVGVGVGLSKADDGAHLLTARIVDPIAVRKIEHGVLRGFSVGIKNPKVVMGKSDAPGGEIVAGDVVEVSVVDRPCNPTTLFGIAKADAAGALVPVEDAQLVEKTDTYGLLPELYDRLPPPVKDALAALSGAGAQVAVEVGKADSADAEVPVLVNVTVTADTPVDGDLGKAYNTAQRRRMAAAGQAMDDGSYPIKSKADLRKTIRAVGRGGADHDTIRAHVISRAKALGLQSMIPDNWNADGSLAANKEDTTMTEPTVDADTIAKSEQILRDVRSLVPELTKADDSDGDGGSEQPDIDGAQAAICAIAQLIISEAESLAQGNLNEACDIALLLQAVDALKWFNAREAAEDDGDTDVELADQPQMAKTAAKNGGKLAPPFTSKKKTTDGDDDSSGTDDENDQDEDDTDDGKKKPVKSASKSDDTDTGTTQVPEVLTKADVADLVKAAIAEARAADEELITQLKADVAKATADLEAVKELPMPGGPVLTRTTAQQVAARKADAEQLRAEARALLAKADAAADHMLRQGYTDRANALLAKADA